MSPCRLKDMTAEKRSAAHQLLRSALSEAGYRQVVAIMRLEEALHQLERFGFSRDRDMENYAFTRHVWASPKRSSMARDSSGPWAGTTVIPG